VWAESFDRPLQSVLDIHGELGTAIAAQVKLKLTPKEQQQLFSPLRKQQEAYDYYLRRQPIRANDSRLPIRGSR
jgi:hypothetical protein